MGCLNECDIVSRGHFEADSVLTAGAGRFFREHVDSLSVFASSYVDVLGLTRLPRPKFPFDGAWLLHGDTMIHLFPPDPEFPSTKTAVAHDPRESWEPRSLRRGRHMAFQVKSVDAAEKRLRAAGVPYTRFGIPGSAAVQVSSMRAPWDRRLKTETSFAPHFGRAFPHVQVFFRDPEGRGIEVGNYAPIAKGELSKM